MLLYQGLRFLPPTPTPPAQWLDMPLAVTTPHAVDAAGTAYGSDLALTEGFWALLASYVALRFVLRATVRALHHGDFAE